MKKNMEVEFFVRRNRVRNYLHFDKKIDNKKIFEYVSNEKNICKHSFFPTISYVLKEKKICRKHGKFKKIEKEDFKVKPRLINFPSHIDGNIYAYYSKKLEFKYEKFLKENDLITNIIAFRKVQEVGPSGRLYSMCNIHFAKKVFDYIYSKKNCYVLCLDISGFFDNLNHEILKKCWCNILDLNFLPKDHYQVYKSLTKYSYVNKKELYKMLGLSLNSRTLHKRYDRLCNITNFRNQVRANGLIKKNFKNKGIPQGSPISGMLSNIYMIDFDRLMKEAVQEVNGQYFRYCDDMIFIVSEEHANKIKMLASLEINKIKLTINDKKTQNIIFEDGVVKKNDSPSFNFPNKLQYLGVLYDGKNVFLRENGLSKYHYKLRKAIRMRSAHYNKIKESGQNYSQNIYMRTLYTRFTYIGKRNYVSYVFRVAKIFESKNIKRQIKGHFNVFNEYMTKRKN